MLDVEETALLERYSRAEISAMELRRALGGITFGDVLIALAKHDLPLPRALQAGREQRIAEARALLFPPAG
jgi:ABC-type polar amino acid transport system ATPase subunit